MKKILLINAFVLLFSLSFARTASAATMSLDPVSGSFPVGQTFNVKVAIDTGGELVTSADAILLYDSSKLEVVDVVEGNLGQEPFFPDFFQNISPSELYIGASVIDPIETRTGTGILATITFRGKAEAVTDVVFDCTPGKTSDTNISKSDKNATDIVECPRLVPGRYTIGGGNPTATPAPTGAPIIPTSTPVPITLTPGSFGVTAAVMGMGVLLIVFALGSKALSAI
jgi:hypothetical protein